MLALSFVVSVAEVGDLRILNRTGFKMYPNNGEVILVFEKL